MHTHANIQGRREPGNNHEKSCQLPVPCSQAINQTAEQNDVYTWHFVNSAKIANSKINSLSYKRILHLKGRWNMHDTESNPHWVWLVRLVQAVPLEYN